MQRITTAAIILSLAATAPTVQADNLVNKERLLGCLVKKVPDILKTYDEKTGRFGKGLWICRDQDVMYALSVAYATRGADNQYYKSPALLNVIIKAGDALIADADAKGQWVFRKKDGSTWGNIWMPWTYSRWVRSYTMIKDDMPADARGRWEKALTLGYTGICSTQFGSVRNIPTHHAMGAYIAGKALNRPEWCKLAADFMQKVVAEQSEGGYWSEGGGPVVQYNEVYVESIGIYYTVSGDERMLPPLQKASEFHRWFSYPTGQCVETIDQRNPYEHGIRSGNVGFNFTPAGRAYLKSQWAALGLDNLNADQIASQILYGQEGPVAQATTQEASQTFVMADKGQDKAAVIRQGPWFACLSAYTSPISTNRWHLDRQNMFSIFHDKVGLVIGGGNTKLQPAWSTFAVGDESLLKHKPGDENPNFIPPAGKLYHVPSAAKLLRAPTWGIEMNVGPETCRVQIEPKNDKTLLIRLDASTTAGMPVAAHLTLLPRLKKMLETGGGTRVELSDAELNLSADQVGGSITHAGWRLKLPATADLRWPTLHHNPYRKDGRSDAAEGRISIRIPFDTQHPNCEVVLQIVD